MAELAVLGAGAAGMVAALCAADRGLRVALVDPHWHSASNLAISGGLIPVAGSRLQALAGVQDSPEQWLADLRAFAGTSVNERIAGAVARALPLLLDCLLERFHAPLRFLADVPASGHSVRRFHAVTPASGAALNDWLRAAVQAHPRIACYREAAVVERAAADFELHLASGPISVPQLFLAGGGFGASASMVRQYIPDMAGALHSGSATNDGSVIALALGWGAALGGMDGYQGQGHTNPGGQTRLGMSIPTLCGILVNSRGLRFVDSDVGPSALAARVLAQPLLPVGVTKKFITANPVLPHLLDRARR